MDFRMSRWRDVLSFAPISVAIPKSGWAICFSTCVRRVFVGRLSKAFLRTWPRWRRRVPSLIRAVPAICKPLIAHVFHEVTASGSNAGQTARVDRIGLGAASADCGKQMGFRNIDTNAMFNHLHHVPCLSCVTCHTPSRSGSGRRRRLRFVMCGKPLPGNGSHSTTVPHDQAP